ncbi:DUF4870 domain-containing protein [Psychrobacillus sp. FSL H8-0484]|uniref:DUF4870 domain-containing protein n=1 Tax=unclassified Psychrobacillus TaxID=2636677 RepID=UPI0030FB6406
MNNNKLLSALSYFSVLFAPFILPIIVYFITQEKEVKYHAKKSLISHVVPVILLIILFISIFANFFPLFNALPYEEPSLWTVSAPILFIFLYMIVYIIILIWNIIQGIKVLR